MKNKKVIIDILFITIGALMAALALDVFLLPNTLFDGGVDGISIILSSVFNIPLSILVFIINIPFIYLGYKNIGKDFLFRSVYAIGLFSIFLYLFESIAPVTEEVILACVFGGALLGIGAGIAIQSGGCLDGSEALALVINKKIGIKPVQVVLALNLLIFSLATVVFGFDRAMYSLLTYFTTYMAVNFVSVGMQQAKAAMIICNDGAEISKQIYKRMGRTVTTIKGKGLISGDKSVLYCVLTRLEVFELKKIVEEMDDSAFVSINDVSEIIGNHIKSNKKRKIFKDNKN